MKFFGFSVFLDEIQNAKNAWTGGGSLVHRIIFVDDKKDDSSGDRRRSLLQCAYTYSIPVMTFEYINKKY